MVRIVQYIGISPVTKKKFKPKGDAVSDHLLLCTHSCANQVKLTTGIRDVRKSPNNERKTLFKQKH